MLVICCGLRFAFLEQDRRLASPLYNSAAHPNISGFRPAGPCRDLVRLRQNRNERFAEAPPSKVVAEILERHFRVDISY